MLSIGAAKYRTSTPGRQVQFVGLFLASVFATSTFASIEYPFFERLAALSGSQRSCSLAVVRSYTTPLEKAQVRQKALDRVYNLARPISGDLGEFLLFLSDIQRREFQLGAAIATVRPESRKVVESQLRQFQGDLRLIIKFMNTLRPRYPFLDNTFDRVFVISQESDPLFDRAFTLLESKREESFYSRAALDEIREQFEEKIAEFVGVFGELQVGLRLPKIVSSSFRLTDLKPQRTIEENARILADPSTGVRDLLNRFDSGRLNWRLQGLTLIQRKAHYALDKEFDLRQVLSPGNEKWIEVKNFAKEFGMSDFNDFRVENFNGSRGEKIKRQIGNSIIIRDIAKKLSPSLKVTLEIHFLQGISRDAKAALEAYFPGNIVIVSGVLQ